MSLKAQRQLDALLAQAQRDAATAVLREQARSLDEVAEELIIRLQGEDDVENAIKVSMLAKVARRLRLVADDVEVMQGPVVVYGDTPRDTTPRD